MLPHPLSFLLVDIEPNANDPPELGLVRFRSLLILDMLYRSTKFNGWVEGMSGLKGGAARGHVILGAIAPKPRVPAQVCPSQSLHNGLNSHHTCEGEPTTSLRIAVLSDDDKEKGVIRRRHKALYDVEQADTSQILAQMTKLA